MTLLFAASNQKEAFNEKLKFWTLKNDYNLVSFEYEFRIPIENQEKNLLIESTG